MFVWKSLFVNNIVLKMFVDIIVGKLLQDFTHPLSMPRGLKSLFYKLNTIISLTIADLCFLFFFFVLLRD
jgi:hypothetical protein